MCFTDSLRLFYSFCNEMFFFSSSAISTTTIPVLLLWLVFASIQNNSRRVFLLFIQFIIIYLYDLYDDIAFGFRKTWAMCIFLHTPLRAVALSCNHILHAAMYKRFLTLLQLEHWIFAAHWNCFRHVFECICWHFFSSLLLFGLWHTVSYTLDGWQNEENIIFLFVYCTHTHTLTLSIYLFI